MLYVPRRSFCFGIALVAVLSFGGLQHAVAQSYPANPNGPAKSVSELVALLKSQPDKMTFSSGGFGTPAHLIGEMFKLQTGTHATHVPYQQFPQAIADLINGTNHFQFIASLPVVDL